MFVLVVVLYAFNSGNTSVAMHDFSSQQACEAAAKIASGATGGPIHVQAVCTPK